MRVHVAFIAAVAIILLSGCSTVAIPVLRHQTAEALGTQRFRVMGHIETARVFEPLATDQTLGIDQGASLFQGTVLGVRGEAGVSPKFDVQLGALFSSSGGGWRLGAKYEIVRLGGRFASAVSLGYGAASGSGTLTYLTAGQPVEMTQTISANCVDLAFPVSFKISPLMTAYSGLIFMRSYVSGNLGSTLVSDYSHDYGTNLGMKFSEGRFEGDVEIAFLRVSDPFAVSGRFIPYFGGSFGVTF
ncbi:hypothetical protein WDW37_04605 [Bdellovibrionota bacterium FG-1]